MKTLIDAFRTLGIAPTGDLNTIHSAYIAGAKRTHPDANPGKIPVSGNDFKLIKNAYDVLKNAFDVGLLDSFLDSNFVKTNLDCKLYSFSDSDLPRDGAGWDSLIIGMSPTDRMYRFNSDIHGYDDIDTFDGADVKYVLINARNPVNNDWGVILAAYLNDNLPLHKDVVSRYLSGTFLRPKDLIGILGGGMINFNFSRDDFIHVYGSSGDFGYPISPNLVKVCLRTLVKTHFPWRNDLGDGNFKIDGDNSPIDIWTPDDSLNERRQKENDTK